jgi:DNA-binding response OmpR family regulator
MLIVLTGWGQEKDRALAREAGFDHHLLKPVDLQALRELSTSSRLTSSGIAGSRP